MTTTAEHRAINSDSQVKRLGNLHQRLTHELHRLERAIHDVRKDLQDVDHALASRVSDLKAMMVAQSYGIPGAGPVVRKKKARRAKIKRHVNGAGYAYAYAKAPKKRTKKTTKRKAR